MSSLIYLLLAIGLLAWLRPDMARRLARLGLTRRVLTGLLGLCLALMAFQHLGWTLYYVQSRSMQPTLQPWDVLLVRSHAAFPAHPAVGDIIVFQAPDGRDYIKRVAALEGQQWKDHRVQIGCVFVLGDHAEVSADSRFLGDIPHQKIRGRAVYRIWPWSRWGKLPAK